MYAPDHHRVRDRMSRNRKLAGLFIALAAGSALAQAAMGYLNG